MPEPIADPNLRQTHRVAVQALRCGVAITVLKFAAFFLTDSMAVLSDAVESIVNILAAFVMLKAIVLASIPPDKHHPYGHGKIEFMAVGLEGVLILLAAAGIALSAGWRWLHGAQTQRVDLGLLLMSVVTALTAALAWHVWRSGRRYENATLVADGKHLATDAITTVGVWVGLMVVWLTGWQWVDHAVALVVAGFIAVTGMRLAREGFDGLMDRADPDDQIVINQILDAKVRQGLILGYHKVRHRHTGSCHWVDMHLQVDGQLSIAEGHARGSEIEREIEAALGQGNATAHVEPG